MFCVCKKLFVAFLPMVFVATVHGFGAPVEGSWTVEPVVALDQKRTLMGDFAQWHGEKPVYPKGFLLNKY